MVQNRGRWSSRNSRRGRSGRREWGSGLLERVQNEPIWLQLLEEFPRGSIVDRYHPRLRSAHPSAEVLIAKQGHLLPVGRPGRIDQAAQALLLWPQHHWRWWGMLTIPPAHQHPGIEAEQDDQQAQQQRPTEECQPPGACALGEPPVQRNAPGRGPRPLTIASKITDFYFELRVRGI